MSDHPIQHKSQHIADPTRSNDDIFIKLYIHRLEYVVLIINYGLIKLYMLTSRYLFEIFFVTANVILTFTQTQNIYIAV